MPVNPTNLKDNRRKITFISEGKYACFRAF